MENKLKEEDERSSSLSEIEDETVDDEAELDQPKGPTTATVNDSEAETERLEQSPQKFRKQRNVVLSAENKTAYEKTMTKLSHSAKAEPRINGVTEQTAEGQDASDGVAHQHTADADVESAAEPRERLSPAGSLAPRKRKRKGPTSRSASAENESGEPARKRTGSIKSDPISDDYLPISLEDKRDTGTLEKDQEMRDDADDDEEGSPSKCDRDMATRAVDGGSRGKAQNGDRVNDLDLDVDSNDQDKADGHEDEGNEAEVEDRADAEDEGVGDVEAAARDGEELLKKKSAMDSLGAIEKHFATFRDRLYDERLAQLSHELSMLTKPKPTHPEYLAMLECVDARRNQKIQLADTLLEYQLGALQRESVAERSQMHSQYRQTVRELRETKLEEVNEQRHQIQRDRKGFEGTIPDYTYRFPTRRSQQISQQTSYNLEVSVLAGVAKHVGFPSAPDIEGLQPSEIEKDLQAMGIKSQSRPTISQGAQPLRVALSVPVYPAATPAAEEQFIEQNAWANPRHPAHHHHHHLHQLQRQASQQSRAGSPAAMTGPSKRRDALSPTSAEATSSRNLATSTSPAPTAFPPPTTAPAASINGLSEHTKPARDGPTGSRIGIAEVSLTNGERLASDQHDSAPGVDGRAPAALTAPDISPATVFSPGGQRTVAHSEPSPLIQAYQPLVGGDAESRVEPSTHDSPIVKEEQLDPDRVSPVLSRKNILHETNLRPGIGVGSFDGR
ncbi:MAG: hypothetical protein M1817_002445 [Caeruleum heppii]|nr:MAG: hypothetical protein M1817_002445 [Caeruleum heppii]